MTPKTHLKPLAFNPRQEAVEAARLLKVLAHPQRLCLLCHMAGGERTVGDLVEYCGLAQPQVSQFLARMKLEGLITARRDGRHIFYTVRDARTLRVLKSLSDIFCNNQGEKA